MLITFNQSIKSIKPSTQTLSIKADFLSAVQSTRYPISHLVLYTNSVKRNDIVKELIKRCLGN